LIVPLALLAELTWPPIASPFESVALVVTVAPIIDAAVCKEDVFVNPDIVVFRFVDSWSDEN
jgi:hypothetical protein